MKLNIEKLDYSVENKNILKEISFNISKGEFVGLIGPNGSGKSTLLKNIYRFLTPDKGTIYIDGKELNKMTSKESAKKMSVLIQENHLEFDINVLEFVLLGRYPYRNMFQENSKKDVEIAKSSLKKVGMLDYAQRGLLNLSGGEKQRILLAKVLAQECEFVVLDEPTNHLDIGNQYQIMNILKNYNATVFASLHDLNIAAMYCDKIIVLNDGKIKSIGKTEDIINSRLIREVFNISANITRNDITKKLQVYYYCE